MGEVIKFNPDAKPKIAASQRDPDVRHKCRHLYVDISEQRHKLICRSCEWEIDPIWWLIREARTEESLWFMRRKIKSELEKTKNQLEDLKRQVRNARAQLKRAKI